LIAGLITSAPDAGAAVTFHRTDTPLAAAPESLAVANMDEVHGTDVLLGFYSGSATVPSTIGVFLNKGDGTFNAPAVHDSCLYGADLHTADLNVDGHQDVVEACFGPLARSFGNGAGDLTAVQTFSFGTRGHVIPAEITGSGAPELVFPSTPDYPGYHQHICFAYADDPSTSTQPNCDNPAPYSAPSYVTENPMAVADISGVPGSPARDEVFSQSANTASAFTTFGRDPNTNYNSWTDVDRDAGGVARSLLAADVSGDGSPDIVIGHGSSTAGSLSVQLWGPSGIPAGQQATTIPTILDPQALGVADFDRDGHRDLAAANGYGQLAIHRGNGDGTFAAAQVIPLIDSPDASYATVVSMKVADFNGDGGADIAVADNVYHKLQILTNATLQAPGGGGPGGSPPPDSDGDGVPDSTDNCPNVANAGQADGNGNGVGTACDPTEKPPSPPPPRTCDNPGTTPFTVGTPGKDVLVGTAGRDVLSGRGGDDCLFGRAGDDRLGGGTGADRLTGGGGDDRLGGDSGADKLTGGNGNDQIRPGSGKDQVVAGGGNDDITARDGARDTIDCGAGRDAVTADRNDQVKNCETVKRARRR
jgi:hypothetical protein